MNYSNRKVFPTLLSKRKKTLAWAYNSPANQTLQQSTQWEASMLWTLSFLQWALWLLQSLPTPTHFPYISKFPFFCPLNWPSVHHRLLVQGLHFSGSSWINLLLLVKWLATLLLKLINTWGFNSLIRREQKCQVFWKLDKFFKVKEAPTNEAKAVKYSEETSVSERLGIYQLQNRGGHTSLHHRRPGEQGKLFHETLLFPTQPVWIV